MLHSYFLYIVVLLIALLPVIALSIYDKLCQIKENKKDQSINIRRQSRENLYIDRLNRNLSKKKKS